MPPKVAIVCRSKLLTESLEKFLSGLIVSAEEADVILTDYPLQSHIPTLRIGTDEEADLKKPFSRSQLMIKLEEKAAQSKTQSAMSEIVEEEASLEEKIAEVMKRYTRELIETVKEHYETKI